MYRFSATGLLAIMLTSFAATASESKVLPLRLLALKACADEEIDFKHAGLEKLTVLMKEPAAFLRYAIDEDDPELIKFYDNYLIGDQPQPLTCGRCPAVCYAARHGRLEAFKALLDIGESIDQKFLGLPLFCLALFGGHLEIVKELEKRGAQYDLSSCKLPYNGLRGIFGIQWSLETWGYLPSESFVFTRLGHGVDETRKITGEEVEHFLFHAHNYLNSFANSKGNKKRLRQILANFLYKRFSLVPDRCSFQKDHHDFWQEMVMAPAEYKNYGYVFHYIAKTDYCDIAQYFLDNGFEVNMRNGDGQTPLHYAAASNSTNMIKLLLNNGADWEIQDGVGKCAADYALQFDAVDALQLLEERGDSWFAKAANQGNNLLFKAAKNDAINLLKGRIGQYEELGMLTDLEGNTLLHAAARGDALVTAQELLRLGAQIDSTNNDGKTPLCSAIQARAHKVLELLLRRGASAESGYPLHLAVQMNNKEACKALLKHGVAWDVQQADGKTPLHIAAMHDRNSIAYELLGNAGLKDYCLGLLGCNLGVHTKDATGQTAEDINKLWAIKSYRTRNQRYLFMMGYTGAIIGIAVAAEATQLHMLAVSGDVRAVKRCLRSGKDPNKRLWGFTPLHYAAWYGHADVAKVLLQKGANPDGISHKSGSELFQHQVCAPLHLAVSGRHTDVVKELLKHGATIDIPTQDKQRTPLHIAGLNKAKDVFNYLKRSGASLTRKDSDGKTPVDLLRDKDASFEKHLLWPTMPR